MGHFRSSLLRGKRPPSSPPSLEKLAVLASPGEVKIELAILALPGEVKIEIGLTHGTGVTLTLTPDGAEELANGLLLGAKKARGEPT